VKEKLKKNVIPETAKIQIIITGGSASYSIDISPENTIENLCKYIENASGIPVQQQTLYFPKNGFLRKTKRLMIIKLRMERLCIYITKSCRIMEVFRYLLKT